MNRPSLRASSAAILAAVSMAVAPVSAAALPASHSPAIQSNAAAAPMQAWDAEGATVHNHRYRDYYRGRYDRYDRRGTSAGDILAGVLIIGAIAAVASAASKPKQERTYPYRGDTGYNGTAGSSQGLDGAADICVREIERNTRVSRVDAVERSAAGWRVTGSLYNGESFTCRIGQDGRIDNVTYGADPQQINRAGEAGWVDDRQWSDDRYIQARNSAGNSVPYGSGGGSATAAGVPAYPGGPIPGQAYEDYPEYAGD